MPRGSHWDSVFATKVDEETSWYQSHPRTSLRLIGMSESSHSLIDVGAGTSTLWEEALRSGFAEVTVLDVSQEALRQTSGRLPSGHGTVHVVVSDLLDWEPPETGFDVWHDRAVFHFLTHAELRRHYVDLARQAIRPDGLLVVGTFAEDGPESCSGLPTARFSPNSLAGLFADDFVLVHSEREEHETPWGAIQPFSWVVMRRQ